MPAGAAAGDESSDPMVDWEEGDSRFSFEDSDRFEEDSLCSWSSEPESLCNNWRGWKKPNLGAGPPVGFGNASRRSLGESGSQQVVGVPAPNQLGIRTNNVLHESRFSTPSTTAVDTVAAPSAITVPPSSAVASLTELAARCVASHIPFELVEKVYPPVPEQLQLRIAFWSFPDNEEDIRLYSCLANGSADEFQRGDYFFKSRNVKDALQIGFHLSATVSQVQNATVGQNQRPEFNVAVTFDRRRITSCNCTCTSTAYWCSHVVAVCLHRIFLPQQVCLRAPVSESLSRLHREQLQKFAQYLISELPQQILPTAQRLLDMLLSPHPSPINMVCGAPDPTAGASANDQTSWYLDEKTLHDNIKKILIKFCVPAPIVFSDVNYLSTTAPPAAAEWSSLLRPLRGREPEGMWNLLSIVREMFKRNDRNAVPLLEIVTEECMACEQIMVWWFNTKVALHNGSSGHGGKHSVNSSSHASQHACSSLCDEIVVLWRLAALNPGLSPEERDLLHAQFKQWHLKIIEKVTKSRGNNTGGVPASVLNKNAATFKNDIEVFSGFKPAIEACYMHWDDYVISGITYSQGSRLYHCPFTCFRHTDLNQINSSSSVLNCEHPPLHHNPHHHAITSKNRARSVDVSNGPILYRRSQETPFQFSPSISIALDAIRSVSLPVHNSGGNRSSVSSEGFCENDADADILGPSNANDTDEGSETSSSGTGNQVRTRPSNSGIRVSDWSDSDSSAQTEQLKQQQASTSSSIVPIASSSFEPASKSAPVTTPSDDRSALTTDEPSTSNASRTVAPPPLPSADKWDSSNSDSQQSGDEYNVYYYDPKALLNSGTNNSAEDDKKEQPSIFANVRKIEEPWEILFARAEALHAHGHSREACYLGVKLALELLANPPDLMVDLPPITCKGKRRKINPASHQLSCLASATLAKCAFLCNVLSESSEHHHLAFKVGMFGLELPRPPASTKPLEVKLANQEADVVQLLKKIPLGLHELGIIRERAEQLRDGTPRSRGEALLPIMLASFIFDSLSLPNRDTRWQLMYSASSRLDTDEALAFEAAVAALGLKANVSEADHPLLCEGTRRQRGDLALTLLVHYKDNADKLARIMEKLLDREVHQLIKAPLLPSYYSSNPPTISQTHSFQRGSGGASRNAQPGQGCRPVSWMRIVPNMRGGEENSLEQSGGPQGMSGSSSTTNEHADPSGINESRPKPCGGSRPHSSTSAELEQNIGALSLSPAQNTVMSTNRNKETRFKGKRAYPSIPNQPSEAGAHFMFELAKTVLTKAGGNSSTSLFTQASASQNHHGPHRALHMCAFQLGLYALGLHNCVSPNWLSRTYSSHVSWITGQAMEIGAPAISFLIDSWEGHLTPPEAVSIADRASRGSDHHMVRAAAELALSCLPHSHALNPNEIQRAILQCKEQSDQMLEHSCLTVENAAKGGGVYPEVLFQVAKYWYELYLRHTPGGVEQMCDAEIPQDNLSLDPAMSLQEPTLDVQNCVAAPSGTVVTASLPNMPPAQQTNNASVPYPTLTPLTAVPYHAVPYSYVQGIPGFAPRMPLQMYLTPPGATTAGYQYPAQPMPSLQYYPAVTLAPTTSQNLRPHHVYHTTTMALPPGAGLVSQSRANQGQAPPPTIMSSGQPGGSLGSIAPNVAPPNGTQGRPPQQVRPQPQPQQAPLQQAPCAQQSLPQAGQQQQACQQPQQQQQFTQAQLRYLLAAYRVGMLAMETLARRVHDDRPQAKYARNPPYGEDVKWLLRVAKKLGTQYLHQFCICAVNSVVSPFILHDIAVEAAAYLSRNNPSLLMQHLRTALTPLVQKCQQMYIQCMHQKLYHLTSTDYEDFVSIVMSARLAFQITPDGTTQFKEWLQSIRRSKSCKKDLWAQINAALQSNNK